MALPLLARPWDRPLAAPIATGAIAAAACFALAVRDPNQAGSWGICPFKAVTGWDCPGCGSLRGIHALTTGDVGQAAGLNILTLIALPFLAWAWLAWLSDGAGWRFPRLPNPVWLVRVLPAVVVLFWVLRNLPFAPFNALRS